jgi:hypothetical protein
VKPTFSSTAVKDENWGKFENWKKIGGKEKLNISEAYVLFYRRQE